MSTNRIEVRSTAFGAGADIPTRYTCEGEDVSPPLSWEPGPAQTASYALIVDDPDAPGGTWVHWVAWNLPRPELPEDVARDARLPDGTCQGKNSWSRVGYGGPCPPSGTHRYVFQVYALDRELELAASTDEAGLSAAMRGHVLAEGQLVGTYAKTGGR